MKQNGIATNDYTVICEKCSVKMISAAYQISIELLFYKVRGRCRLINYYFLAVSQFFLAHLLSNAWKFWNFIETILRRVVVLSAAYKLLKKIRVMLLMNHKIRNHCLKL